MDLSPSARGLVRAPIANVEARHPHAKVTAPGGVLFSLGENVEGDAGFASREENPVSFKTLRHRA